MLDPKTLVKSFDLKSSLVWTFDSLKFREDLSHKKMPIERFLEIAERIFSKTGTEIASDQK